MEIESERKHTRLTTILIEMGSALLAFSGGVDRAVREQVVSCMKDLGFLYAALDLEGYRTGSMNLVLVEGSSGNRTPPR